MKRKLPRRTIIVLESLLMTDQTDIRRYHSGTINAQELNKLNKQRADIFTAIIKKHGFPTITNSSPKAYKAAVLTVLHSGDIVLLKDSADTLIRLPEKKVEKRDIAFMIDKAQVLQNLPQIYGTQYRKMKNGRIKFLEMQRREKINECRAKLGMETFEKYEKEVRKLTE